MIRTYESLYRARDEDALVLVGELCEAPGAEHARDIWRIGLFAEHKRDLEVEPVRARD